jgi:hypothetical protein
MTWFYVANTIIYGVLSYMWSREGYSNLLTKAVITIMFVVSAFLLLENLGYIVKVN